MKDFSFDSAALGQIQAAQQIRAVLQASLKAADPYRAVQAALVRRGEDLYVGGERYALGDFKRVLLTGFGKAGVAMAQAAVEILGERVTDSAVIVKHLPGAVPGLEGIHFYPGNHPVPGEDSVRSTQALLRLVEGCTAEDLVICLVSGGGSALFTAPVEDVSLDSLQQLTQRLLASGADINEINAIRKHLDQVKGGGLAGQAYPAQVVALVLSDVVGSPLDVIASGPTVADRSTLDDVDHILEKYRLGGHLPGEVEAYLRKARTQGWETPKPGDARLARTNTQVVASNALAAQAAVEAARAQGFHAGLLSTRVTGEAAVVGGLLAGILCELAGGDGILPRPACLVAGGETTVTLRGDGLGGRNLETALGAVQGLEGVEKVALITLATDGEDGPSGAAGAVVTGETWSRARALELDPAAALGRNDSRPFFALLEDLLVTGPTGTNVNDLAFLVAY
ncbi:MAG: DUF4147 domain-containing protein [Anaerolineaceae bacterium]|nr:DUF4147 domain-containing protein [Anaerolineaceae bacterium]